MPNDLGDELGDGQNDVCVRRDSEQAVDRVRVLDVAVPNGFIESEGQLEGCNGRGQLDVIPNDISIDSIEIAQTMESNSPCLRRLPSPKECENVLKPLPRSAEIPPVLVVKPNHESDDEGGRGLEWAVVGEGGGGNDEQVEEETEGCETDHHTGDGSIEEEEVVGECIAEEEESNLKYEGQRFHHEVEVPGDHSVQSEDSIPTAIGDGSAHLHLGKPVEPLLTQGCNECSEEGGSQTGVKD